MEWIRSKECQEHVDNELKKQRKEFLDDWREVMGWSKNELPFDSETNIRLRKKEKKWEAI